jgi:serpin B
MTQKKHNIIVLISIIVFAIVFILGVCSCKKQEDTTIELPEVIDMSTAREPDEFYEEFHMFMANSNLKNENFVVSPLSFRTSMITIANGAKGNTQKEVLNAMGFSTIQEYEKWYKEIKQETDFNLYNPIWNNTSFNNSFFNSDFIDYIKKNYSLTINDSNNNKIGNEINQFFNNNVGKSTSDYIKHNHDFSKTSSVFVNAAQVKSLWKTPFAQVSSYSDNFLTKSGEKVNKEYMKNLSYFNYYKDENTELVSVPLENNVFVAFVTGDISNVYDNIDKSIQQEVILSLPSCSVSTKVDSTLFEEYLKNRGVKSGFNSDSDFSNMTNKNFTIQNIMQASEITINEIGVNVPSSVISVGSSPIASQNYTAFTIDKSYYFLIYCQTENNSYNTIFFGQVCN